MTEPPAPPLRPTPSSPLVAIVLINYNGWAHTEACLDSLAGLEYPHTEVLLVDNGSTDDSLERMGERHPANNVLPIPHNVGFTAANNVGTREALRRGADYIWFLNNDTSVDPGALSALLRVMEARPRVGAAAPVLYDMRAPGRVQAWGGGVIDLWRGTARLALEPTEGSRLDFLSGTSLLVRRRATETVGLLDERYFMYWEDADFSLRLRRAGWELAVAEDARVWHLGSASLGENTLTHKSVSWEQNFTKSAVRFFCRHAPLPPVPLLAGPGFYLLKRVLRGQWARAGAVARGGWLAFQRSAR